MDAFNHHQQHRPMCLLCSICVFGANSTQCTLLVQSYPAHTPYITPHTANTALNTAHCTLHTANCKHCTAHCSLHTERCTLNAAHCTLHTLLCRLHTSHCTLHNAHCTPYTVFYGVYCRSNLERVAASINRASFSILFHRSQQSQREGKKTCKV